MAFGADGTYYDPYTYTVTGADWESALGVSWWNTVQPATGGSTPALDFLPTGSGDRYSANRISIVGDRDSQLRPVLGAVAPRRGADRADVGGVAQPVRGPVRPACACARPIPASAPRRTAARSSCPTRRSSPRRKAPPGRWKVTETRRGCGRTAAWRALTAPLVRADAATANADVMTLLGRSPDQAGALLPAGRGLAQRGRCARHPPARRRARGGPADDRRRHGVPQHGGGARRRRR